MKYILVGLAGFGLAFLFDWLSLKRLPVIKPLAWVAVLALLIYAIIKLSVEALRFSSPAFTAPLGICLLVPSTCLLIYSLFIEIPFVATYVTPNTSKLVSSGTYALVRHPGVIWLAFVFVSLLLLFPSITLFVASIIWLGADVLHVFIQDKFIFPKMFPDYSEYRRRTPFLIPNCSSFRACLRTFGIKNKSAKI